MVQLAPDWLSWQSQRSVWWRDTDEPAASEPAECDTWWDFPGESAPGEHRADYYYLFYSVPVLYRYIGYIANIGSSVSRI